MCTKNRSRQAPADYLCIELQNGPARDLVDKKIAAIQTAMQRIRDKLYPELKEPAKLPAHTCAQSFLRLSSSVSILLSSI